MSNIQHFAINADDLSRARNFYEEVFGWRFQPWGPPDFFQIETGPNGIRGALQKRREISGHRMPGIECTIAVDDIDRVIDAIDAAGGKVIMPKTTIEGVGDLIFFEDSEGNVAGAMRYAERS